MTSADSSRAGENSATADAETTFVTGRDVGDRHHYEEATRADSSLGQARELGITLGRETGRLVIGGLRPVRGSGRRRHRVRLRRLPYNSHLRVRRGVTRPRPDIPRRVHGCVRGIVTPVLVRLRGPIARVGDRVLVL